MMQTQSRRYLFGKTTRRRLIPAISCITLFYLISLNLCPHSSALSISTRKDKVSSECGHSRRFALSNIIFGFTAMSTCNVASAANLPESYGADLSKTGTVETLVPIVKLRQDVIALRNLFEQVLKNQGESVDSLQNVMKQLSNSDSKLIDSIPISDEAKLKRIFDSYSDPVSYKQRFLDNNAFLVYYTKGLDGPGRPSIESEVPLQVLQYGARNDIWVALKDFGEELNYAKKGGDDSSLSDLLKLLNRSIELINAYIDLAPKNFVDEAEKIM